MSSFFTLPGSAAAKKRKRTAGGAGGEGAGKKARGTGENRKSSRREEDEISSESEDEGRPRRDDEEEEDSEEEFAGETAAERRLRLAQQYLDNIREEVDEGGFDAEEIDRDLIAERLQGDVAESKGRLYRHIASTYSFHAAVSTLFRSDNKTTTAVAVCNPHIYTVTRDRYLNKWLLPTPPTSAPQSNLTSSRKPKRIRYARGSRKHDTNFAGHIDDILCVAASESGKFVATGGKDNRLVVWDAEELKVLKVFHQHRSPVTGLVFRRGTNQLYSCSADRTVKLWSLDELAYVETLFGHQDEVVGISALAAERCVTVGARDRTARLWKIVDETQLVFRGSQPGDKARKNKDGTDRYEEGSMDCVAMIDDEHFVTGSDNGNISLWSVHKKKPVHSIPLAHGLAPPPPPHLSSAELEPPSEPPCPPQARYITALAAIPYSDLIFSGSWDGAIRAWKISADKKRLEPLGAIGEEGKVRGVVNGLAVIERGGRTKGEDGKSTGKEGDEEILVVAGVGEELRMGRWMKVGSRNGGYVLEVRRGAAEAADVVMEDD